MQGLKLGNLLTLPPGWAVSKMGIQLWDLFPGAVEDPPTTKRLATAYIEDNADEMYF